MKKTMDLIKNASCSNSPKENSHTSPNRPSDSVLNEHSNQKSPEEISWSRPGPKGPRALSYRDLEEQFCFVRNRKMERNFCTVAGCNSSTSSNAPLPALEHFVTKHEGK